MSQPGYPRESVDLARLYDTLEFELEQVFGNNSPVNSNNVIRLRSS